MATALFIGRFQPLHKGHVEYLRKILKRNKLKVVIGSAQEKNTEKNPFSARERKHMLKLCFQEPIEIYSVRDYPGDNKRWIDTIKKKVGEFEVVYIGENQLVHDIFTEAGYKVKTMKRIRDISSTRIRKLIKENKDWKDFVPKAVYKYIISIGGEERIRKI